MESNYAQSTIPKLIYIMGDGRSGSTILSIILGNHPAIESVGELSRWLVFAGYPKPGDDRVEHHAFWQSVREAYLDTGPVPNFSELVRAQQEIEEYKNFPKALFGRIEPDAKTLYRTHTARLLDAICRVSGKPILVDSSKNMGRACMLLRFWPEKVRVIHLVRDPRGTLWSQMKRNIEQEYKLPVTAMVHYSFKNLMAAFVQWHAPKNTVLRVRYEDICMQPRTEIERIGAFLELPMTSLTDILEKTGTFRVPYLLDGNRVRRQTEIELRFDNQWRQNLSRKEHALAIGLTFPFFLIYRYQAI